MNALQEELKAIDARVAHRRKAIADHEACIKLELQRRSMLYCDSGLLPTALRSEEEKSRLNKMPRYQYPCEFCGSDNVRKGKALVCLDCLHMQGGVAKKG